MRRFLLAIAPAFLLCNPALADFGSADTGASAGNEVSIFNAKCGEEMDPCELEIDFENAKVIVDGSSYVEKSRIKEARYMIKERSCILGGTNCSVPLVPPKHTTDITYRKQDGSISTARIMFRDLNVGRRFFDSIALFLGVSPEDVNKQGLSGLVVNIEIPKKVRDTVNDQENKIPFKSIGIALGSLSVAGIGAFLFVKNKKRNNTEAE